MNRNEFLNQLEQLLANISKEEREEALQYYRDYFEDAGSEHEMDVLRELESPEKVAATILSDSESSEGDSNHEELSNLEEIKYEEHRGKSSWKEWGAGNPGKMAILIIACIFCAPIVLPIAFALVMMVFSLIVAAFSVFVGLVLSAGAIGIAGIVVVVTGFPLLMVAFPTGILAIGSGLILGVLGVIGVVGAVKLCTIVFPALIRFVKKLFNRIFRKEK